MPWPFHPVKGGDTPRTWSNKLMRLRVVAQFIAVIIIMLVLWATQNGH